MGLYELLKGELPIVVHGTCVCTRAHTHTVYLGYSGYSINIGWIYDCIIHSYIYMFYSLISTMLYLSLLSNTRHEICQTCVRFQQAYIFLSLFIIKINILINEKWKVFFGQAPFGLLLQTRWTWLLLQPPSNGVEKNPEFPVFFAHPSALWVPNLQQPLQKSQAKLALSSTWSLLVSSNLRASIPSRCDLGGRPPSRGGTATFGIYHLE